MTKLRDLIFGKGHYSNKVHTNGSYTNSTTKVQTTQGTLASTLIPNKLIPQNLQKKRSLANTLQPPEKRIAAEDSLENTCQKIKKAIQSNAC